MGVVASAMPTWSESPIGRVRLKKYPYMHEEFHLVSEANLAAEH